MVSISSSVTRCTSRIACELVGDDKVDAVAFERLRDFDEKAGIRLQLEADDECTGAQSRLSYEQL